MSEKQYDNLFEIVEDENHTPDVPPTDAEFDLAAKIISASDEVAAQNKEELEQLESPLIVHKSTDASYQETASGITMEETHVDDDQPTLERHRFRKQPKKKGRGALAFLVVIVIACAVFAGVYFGAIAPNKAKPTTTHKSSGVTQTTTTIQQAYEGKIVVKGTYIFVDGIEVDGIDGLQRELKYQDPSPTKYEIVKENANADFLNNDILPLMLDMGFYNKKTVISTIAKTGLVAKDEMTTVKKQTQTSKPTTKKQTTESNVE